MIMEASDMNNNRWVTVAATAAALDVHPDRIYAEIRKGTFPFRTVRIGKHIRVCARELGLLDEEAQPQQPEAEVRATAA
jgi:helix-turn-helix protein